MTLFLDNHKYKYFCEKCEFFSDKKTDFNRHLSSQKHKFNEASNYEFKCKNCEKFYKTKSGLWKHLKKCEINFTNKNMRNELLIQDLLVQNKDLQEKLIKQNTDVEKLEKVCNKVLEIAPKMTGGNTFNNTNNINQTNNIQLNSFGNEDLSHITDSLKTQLLNIPFGMIPKLIEYVHFSSDKPENKNIVLTNKNDNKIKIFSQGKWVFRNKNETISNLVDEKYYLLHSHFDVTKDTLDQKTVNKYDTFRKEYDNNTDELLKKLKQDCELTLLNNR